NRHKGVTYDGSVADLALRRGDVSGNGLPPIGCAYFPSPSETHGVPMLQRLSDPMIQRPSGSLFQRGVAAFTGLPASSKRASLRLLQAWTCREGSPARPAPGARPRDQYNPVTKGDTTPGISHAPAT